MLSVEISFQGSEDDGTLFVSIHNPQDLPSGLFHQIKRYGLSGPSSHKPHLSGRSNGTRKALTELIQTYGCTLQIVPFRENMAE